jgi:hypothetical protein
MREVKTLAVAVVGLLLLLAVPASAVTVGVLNSGGGSSFISSPLTLISYSHPADADGTVSSATVIWTNKGATCTPTVKIKFFRRTTTSIFMIAERGPFTVNDGVNTLPLSPPVTLTQGDFIAATQLVTDCGGISLSDVPDHFNYGLIEGDATGTIGYPRVGNGIRLNMTATSDTTGLTIGYLPVVGSLAGNFGSFFRTSVQLTNRTRFTISGKLVFHPAGVAASPTDPSTPFTLAGYGTVTYNDVLAAIGRTGLGTMDLVMTTGQPPDVTARIYNDAGASGTSGFTEELVSPGETLNTLDQTTITIPNDLTNFRLNVGIRAFGKDVTLNVNQLDTSGNSKGGGSITIAANSFRQIGAAELIGGAALVPGGSLFIQVTATSGRAIIYGAVTDNRTNDGSYRLATSF